MARFYSKRASPAFNPGSSLGGGGGGEGGGGGGGGGGEELEIAFGLISHSQAHALPQVHFWARSLWLWGWGLICSF